MREFCVKEIFRAFLHQIQLSLYTGIELQNIFLKRNLDRVFGFVPVLSSLSAAFSLIFSSVRK